MEEFQEEKKPFDKDQIRRPFKVNMEAGVAKRFIKACHEKKVYIRETMKEFMENFADSVLGKEEK